MKFLFTIFLLFSIANVPVKIMCDKVHIKLTPNALSHSQLPSSEMEGVESESQCNLHCFYNKECASFNYIDDQQKCVAFKDKDPTPEIVEGSKSVYGEVKNRDAVDVCSLTDWSEWTATEPCFFNTQPISMKREQSVILNQSSVVRTCPELVQSETSVTYCLQYQNPCAGMTTFGSPLSPIINSNTSIVGTPYKEIGPLASIQQCRCDCQKNFHCQMAEFTKNGMCILHGKSSIKHVVTNQTSSTIDLQISGYTRILIIGGYSGAPLTSVYLLIPEVPAVILAGTMVNGRNHLVAGIHNNELWVHGGGAAKPIEKSIGLPFDFQVVNEIVVDVDMPSYASRCGGVHHGKLYACFYNNQKCDVVNLNTLEVSSITTTVPVTNHASCTFDPDQDIMYVVGGGAGGTQSLNHMVSLVNGNTISRTSFPTSGHPGVSGAAVWFDGAVVVCGGANGINDCNKYDPTTNQWAGFTNLRSATYFHGMANWGDDKIVTVGGRDMSTSPLKSIEVYSASSWTFLLDMPNYIRAFAIVNIEN